MPRNGNHNGQSRGTPRDTPPARPASRNVPRATPLWPQRTEIRWADFLATLDDPDERAFFAALHRTEPGLAVCQDDDGQWHVIGIKLTD